MEKNIEEMTSLELRMEIIRRCALGELDNRSSEFRALYEKMCEKAKAENLAKEGQSNRIIVEVKEHE